MSLAKCVGKKKDNYNIVVIRLYIYKITINLDIESKFIKHHFSI